MMVVTVGPLQRAFPDSQSLNGIKVWTLWNAHNVSLVNPGIVILDYAQSSKGKKEVR